MILLKKLQQQGWYLTEEGLNKLIIINNLQTEDVNKIIPLALDWDLRDIAGGALPPKPDNNGTISGRIVLQLQKMRNISAPKANEESTAAPRFLQLELSDGVNTIVALEFERITNLNLNVPPGTKLFIKSEKLNLVNGILILKSSDIQILGGKVEALVEKWEISRQMLKYARSNRRLSGSGGPPPWIAFGTRSNDNKDAPPTDRNFKSLQTANEKDKNSKENDEFNASRVQAIAEAAKAGKKKVFGGGQQNILDHNVKKILEKGYSAEEAKQALKTTNNNLERALYNLKRKYNFKSESSENNKKSISTLTGGRTKDRGGMPLTKEEAAAAKPQTNVSLFDFLTDKLPASISHSSTNSERISKDTNSIKTYDTNTINTGSNRFENNMSSSFAANRANSTKIPEDKPNIQTRSNNSNRKQEERNQQSDKIGKGERYNLNKKKAQISTYNKKQNKIPTVLEDNGNLTCANNNTRRNERPITKERDQKQKHSASENQANKRPNNFSKVIEKSYQSREINRNYQDSKSYNYQQRQMDKLNSFEEDLYNLVDSASKLAIQNKKNVPSHTQTNKVKNHLQTSECNKIQQVTRTQQLQKSEKYANNSQQHSFQVDDSQNFSSKTFQQNANLPAYSPQLNNCIAYDPSKIIGFQSKEANEYAMNMLKSQGMTSPQTQATSLHPPPQQLNKQASAAVAYMAQNANIFVPPVQQVPPVFSMLSGENWPWKEGDLCLAKYWDDGNYYNAKITAISEKTCVVLFLGYGNHEEVLKSDCVPVADAQHVPINAYQTNITSISQPPLPAFQHRSNLHSSVGSVGNQRNRSERQMYVPPAKRNNK